jgi:hypothetical protein
MLEVKVLVVQRRHEQQRARTRLEELIGNDLRIDPAGC